MAFALPSRAYAAIELRYVNARQAYIDTFYNKTVAQLIYDESVQHNVNPRLILVILQRESSAITQSTPSSDTRRAWPMFYNYDERMASCIYGDESACNDTKYNKPDYGWRAENYGGVGQQIAYATAQFRNLHDNYCGSRVVPVDGQNITTDNQASCALYKYTPHYVSYNTNSAFYLNWVAWWGGTPNGGGYSSTNIISEDNFSNVSMSAADINNFLIGKGSWLANYVIPEYISVPYPAVASSWNPTLIKTESSPAVYLVFDGMRHHIPDLQTFSVWGFNWGNVSIVSQETPNGYSEGAPLSYLFKGSGEAVYLGDSRYKYHIPNPTTFNNFGFSWGEVSVLPDGLINAIPYDGELNNLIKGSGPAAYALDGGVKRHIESLAAFRAWEFRWDITVLSDSFIGSIPSSSFISQLAKSPNDLKIYLIQYGKRRWITSMDVFRRNGYRWEFIGLVSDGLLNSKPEGSPLR